MSALTKVFVILLVVCSLLMSAGIVVYVNKDEDYRKSNANLKRLLDEATVNLNREKLDASAAVGALQKTLTETQGQIQNKQDAYDKLLQQLADKNTEIARLTTSSAMNDLEKTSLADALKAAQEQASKLQKDLGDTRTRNNDVVVQNSQLNQTVSELQNKLDATERERKFLTEQLAQVQSQATKLNGLLKDAGINPDTTNGPVALGAPSIRGVIRDVRSIANVPYATISVGSSDAVAQGMEFKVIDRQSAQFLGYLKVDMVEANQATGRLEGPRVSDIHAGSEVVTQIQG